MSDVVFQRCDPDDPCNVVNEAFNDLFNLRQKALLIFQACDSIEAITESLESLETFKELIKLRHEAGYEKDMRLSEWIVLGRFMLDTCGNFSKIRGNGSYEIVPAEKYPNFPNVMTQSDLFEYIESHKEKPDEHISICSSPSWFPEATQICPVCKKGWTVDNCHDFVDSHDDQVINAKDFVGQTVADFKASWNKDNHEIYWFLRGETNLRNKKYIDRTIVVNNIWKAENKHQVNERGWVETKDDHIIEEGDFLYIHQVIFRHNQCYRAHQARKEKAFFKLILQKAGFSDISMTQIPNQYHGGDCIVCAPWYQVKADGINLTIGKRKRVIEIESPEPGLDMRQLFPDEDVTKGKEFIHAWDRQKCIEYLQKIRTQF